ncbi:MAG: hypothetical protein ABI321_02915 [Polyangia bacterium]
MRTLCLALLVLGCTPALADDAPPKPPKKKRVWPKRHREKMPHVGLEAPNRPVVGIEPPDEPLRPHTPGPLEGTRVGTSATSEPVGKRRPDPSTKIEPPTPTYGDPPKP